MDATDHRFLASATAAGMDNDSYGLSVNFSMQMAQVHARLFGMVINFMCGLLM